MGLFSIFLVGAAATRRDGTVRDPIGISAQADGEMRTSRVQAFWFGSRCAVLNFLPEDASRRSGRSVRLGRRRRLGWFNGKQPTSLAHVASERDFCKLKISTSGTAMFPRSLRTSFSFEITIFPFFFLSRIPVRSEFLTQWREEILWEFALRSVFFRLAITRRTNSGTARLIRSACEKVARRRDRMIGANVVCVRKKKAKHMIQNTRGVSRPFFGPVAALNLCHG